MITKEKVLEVYELIGKNVFRVQFFAHGKCITAVPVKGFTVINDKIYLTCYIENLMLVYPFEFNEQVFKTRQQAENSLNLEY